MIGPVIDTSVFVKFLFVEENSDKAAMLLTDVVRGGWAIEAPVVVRSEMTSVVRKRMREDRLPLVQAQAILDQFLAIPMKVADEPALYRQALTLTEAYSLSAYDAQFVALAQVLGCNLWVADERLLRAVGARLPFVRRLGEYTGEP